MKKLVVACLALSVLVACNLQVKNDQSSADSTSQSTENLGKIVFEEDSFDFGTIKEGEIVDHVFKFKNEGNAPVILAQVSASCGCTTPNYTKEPVLPGKEGEVKVSFKSSGQVGVQQKFVTISSNAENAVLTVQIKGKVEK